MPVYLHSHACGKFAFPLSSVRCTACVAVRAYAWSVRRPLCMYYACWIMCAWLQDSDQLSWTVLLLRS